MDTQRQRLTAETSILVHVSLFPTSTAPVLCSTWLGRPEDRVPQAGHWHKAGQDHRPLENPLETADPWTPSSAPIPAPAQWAAASTRHWTNCSPYTNSRTVLLGSRQSLVMQFCRAQCCGAQAGLKLRTIFLSQAFKSRDYSPASPQLTTKFRI